MRIDFRILGLAVAGSALIGLAQMAACTGDSGGGASGTGGSTGAPGANGGTTGTPGGTGGSTAAAAGVACAKPIVLTKPGIANFDNYDSASDLSTWNFPLGGDTTSSILAGTFGYGDRPNGLPETFMMITPGSSSTYALEVADTASAQYGGGMGIWISECLDAKSFSGVSFWTRGSAPTGKAKLSILMKETTAATPAKTGNKTGTCPGTDTTCIHPNYMFTVTDTWTQIQIPWASFTKGDAAGTPVTPDGSNIWQIQFDIGLNWVPGPTDGGAYVPVPGAYKLDVDTITFY